MEKLMNLDSEKSKQKIAKNVPLKKAFGKAKLFEIRRLVRRIKQLSAKKGTSQQVEKNKRKVSRLDKELEVLKDIHVDTFIEAASAKVQGNEFNTEDFVSKDEEGTDEDLAAKTNMLEKIINSIGVDNIKDLASTVKKGNKKSKSKTSQQVEKNKRKVSRLDKELEVLKDIHVDTFIEAASAKVQGDEFNTEDCASKDDKGTDQDLAAKTNLLEKIINNIGVDNIKDLASTVKKEKEKSKSNGEEKRLKTLANISSKTKKRLPHKINDNVDNELGFFKSDIEKAKDVGTLDDFFCDPVAENCNSVYIDKSTVNFTKKRAERKRKLAVEDDFGEISTKAFDTVFVGNLKSGKEKSGDKKRKSSNMNNKNRLGQRERRKQWVELYGNRAYHFYKEEQEMMGGKRKSSMSKGLKDVKRSRAVEKSNASLHPSWEASKSKRKQEAIVEFKGQKITFED